MHEMSEDEKALVESIAFPDLRVGESVLSAPDERLWRQVHPNHVEMQVVSGEAFIETVAPAAFVGGGAAKYEVSTSMSSIVTAEKAYEHYTQYNKSYGTYMVTVGHVSDGFARVVDDSSIQPGNDPVIGHAYVDLRGMHKVLQRRARSILADAATKTGRIHPES